jgi:hypothetical protein
MKIAMTSPEKDLFLSFLKCSRRYVEFGAGGSTYFASSLVAEAVTSVDSSQEWLEKVRIMCLENKVKNQPKLIHVDIGDVGEWGYPLSTSKKINWKNYHSSIWSDPECSRADLYLVDGRFRVSCFTQIILHSRPDALIAIHDFSVRPQYHVVCELANEIARAENFSVFMRKADYDPHRATEILGKHEANPE